MDDKEKNESALLDMEAKESRRGFLKKAGKLAVYTPPAMMVLMKPSYATLNKSHSGRPHKHKYRRVKRKVRRTVKRKVYRHRSRRW